MPLSKKRMRERKRNDRVKPTSNLITVVSVKPNEAIKQATLKEFRKMIDNPVKPNVQPKPVRPPKYNPRIHKAGDVVTKDNVIVMVPELDGENNVVPEYGRYRP